MGFPTTNAEIVNDALFRAGELFDGSSDYEAKALEYLNRVYTRIAAGGTELDQTLNEKWWWLRSTTPCVLTLLPIEIGVASVVNGSSAVVFSVAPTISLAGRFFRTIGTQDVFRILTHTALDVNAVLDSVYTGQTNAAIAWEASKLEYDLPANVMEVIEPIRCYQGGKRDISGMDLSALEGMYPLDQSFTGTPEAFSQIGNRKLRFSHQGGSTPGELIRVDFDYLVLPTNLAKDAQECLLPVEWRSVLADFTCMMILADKDDSKAGDMGNLAKAGLMGMAKENRNRTVQFSNNYGHIYPRPYSQRANRYPLRTTGGRIIGS